MMKLTGTLGATALFSMTFVAPALSADTFTWSTMGTSRNPIVKCGPMNIANQISKITGRKQEVHLGQSAFANPRKLYPQLARGVTDFTWGILSYTPGRFPLTEIVSLPFVAQDNKAASYAVNKLAPKYLTKEFRDIKLFAIAIPGLYQIHLKKPAADLSSGLKGVRLRVVGSGLSAGIRAMGADVVALPMPSAYENLQKGVISGFLGPNAALVAFKLHEVTNYHVQANIAGALLFAGVSKKFWASLTDAQRAKIDSTLAGPDAGRRYSSCWDKVDRIGVALAKKSDGTVRALSGAEEKAMRAKMDPIVEAYLAKLEKRGLPARAFHKELLAEIKKAKR